MLYPNLIGGGGGDAFTIPVMVLSKQIKDHLIDITQNHVDSMSHYSDIIRNILASPFPCNTSKKLTNGLCGYKGGFGLVDFKQIKTVVNEAKSLVKSMTKSSDIQSTTVELQSNLKKIGKLNKKQTDGIICHVSKFITNGICKVNEITIDMLNPNLQLGLIGLNVIPDKLRNIMNTSQDIIDSGVNTSAEVSNEIESMRDDIDDIDTINDTIETTLDDADIEAPLAEEVGDGNDYEGMVDDAMGIANELGLGEKIDKKDKSIGKDTEKPAGKDNAKKPVGKDNAKKPAGKDNAKKPVGKDNAKKPAGKDTVKKSSKKTSKKSKKKGGSKKQRGGGNIFNYISHPVSNKMLHINGAEGQRVLHRYMNIA